MFRRSALTPCSDLL